MFGSDVETFLSLQNGQTYKPVLSLMVLEPIASSTITAGKVIIPEAAVRANAKVGRVVRQGPGDRDADGKELPLIAKIGDIVVLNPTRTVYGLKEGATSYYVAGDSDVVGFIDNYVEEPAEAPAEETAPPAAASKILVP